MDNKSKKKIEFNFIFSSSGDSLIFKLQQNNLENIINN